MFFSKVFAILFVAVAISSSEPIKRKAWTILDLVDDNNDLQNQLFDLQNQLASLTKSLKSSPSTLPSMACTIQNTPVQHHTSGITYDQLSAHDISCPQGKVLTRFQLVSVPVGTTGEANVHFEYVCCSLIA